MISSFIQAIFIKFQPNMSEQEKKQQMIGIINFLYNDKNLYICLFVNYIYIYMGVYIYIYIYIYIYNFSSLY